MRYEETKYGFNYGALDIERTCSDEKKGWIVITLRTKKISIQVYVTKTGKIRLHDECGREFKVKLD